jgi:hypothetical protein
MEQLAAAQHAAIETCEPFRAAGKNIRYLRSTFVPKEAVCRCLFEAPDAEMVKAVNEEANIPFARVVEALDLAR